MARGQLLRQLLQRLATVPETVELARATGLTLPHILYNAQMIRTWSLLLRNAQRQGYASYPTCMKKQKQKHTMPLGVIQEKLMIKPLA